MMDEVSSLYELYYLSKYDQEYEDVAVYVARRLERDEELREKVRTISEVVAVFRRLLAGGITDVQLLRVVNFWITITNLSNRRLMRQLNINL